MSDNKHDVSVSAEAIESVSDTVFTGEHDTKGTMFDNSELIEWSFDEKALFETISHKIYESDEAAVREPIFNAVSAALRASIQDFIDEPRVAVYLYKGDEDSPMTLIIRDNGMGVTEEMLTKSMSYIGRSQNRYVADLMGKFGFGFLAAFRLVTSTGVFFMHTRARETEESYRGAWSNAGFEIDHGGEIDQVLDDDEYGTRLEFPIKSNISRSQIRSWVKDNAQNARIPVEYYERGFGDDLNEEYGGQPLDAAYDNPDAGYVIDTDMFVAHCHPSATNRTLCLDAPISRTTSSLWGRALDAPFAVDIRFKSENGGIIEGPNKGQTPVSDAEYSEIPEELQEAFIKRSQLSPSDIEVPHPTGSRDTLSQSEEFWNWLGEQFDDKQAEAQSSAVQKLVDGDFNSLTSTEALSIQNIDIESHRNAHKPNTPSYVYTVDDPIPEDSLDIIEAISQDVLVISDEDELTNDRTHFNPSGTSTAISVHQNAQSEEFDVYMGVNVHAGKFAVVDEADFNSVVVKIPRGNASETYGIYEELFGWHKIKNIDLDDEKFDSVDEETKNRVRKNGNNSSLEDKELTVHMQSQKKDKERYRVNISIGDIRNGCFQESDDDDKPRFRTPIAERADKLVLFPSTGDASVSSNYHLIEEGYYAVARCTKTVADSLIDHDDVVLYTNIKEEISDMSVQTGNGTELVSDLTNPVFYTLDDDDLVAELQDDADFRATAQQAFEENINSWYRNRYYNNSDDDNDDPTFVPVTSEDLSAIRPIFSDYQDYKIIEATKSNKKSERGPCFVALKAYYELDNWRENDAFHEILDELPQNGAAETMLQTWQAAHEAGLDMNDL